MAGKLKPDARHTYGWRRASILAAFINALLLLVAMGSLGWEAAGRLRSPEPTEGWTIMAVAGMGIVINTTTALLFMRGREGDLNIRGAFMHMAADALVSLGVVIGGAIYLWQGWMWIDPVMSLGIAVIIVMGTWGLFKQSLHLLFDGVPEGIDLEAVRTMLLGLPGASEVHDLHVWAMGTSQIALTAHVVLRDAGADTGSVLHEAEYELREHFIANGLSEIQTMVIAAVVGASTSRFTMSPCSWNLRRMPGCAHCVPGKGVVRFALNSIAAHTMRKRSNGLSGTLFCQTDK